MPRNTRYSKKETHGTYPYGRKKSQGSGQEQNRLDINVSELFTQFPQIFTQEIIKQLETASREDLLATLALNMVEKHQKKQEVKKVCEELNALRLQLRQHSTALAEMSGLVVADPERETGIQSSEGEFMPHQTAYHGGELRGPPLPPPLTWDFLPIHRPPSQLDGATAAAASAAAASAVQFPEGGSAGSSWEQRVEDNGELSCSAVLF